MSMPGGRPSVRVAVVQHPPVFLNLEASIEMACSHREAACRRQPVGQA